MLVAQRRLDARRRAAAANDAVVTSATHRPAHHPSADGRRLYPRHGGGGIQCRRARLDWRWGDGCAGCARNDGGGARALPAPVQCERLLPPAAGRGSGGGAILDRVPATAFRTVRRSASAGAQGNLPQLRRRRCDAGGVAGRQAARRELSLRPAFRGAHSSAARRRHRVAGIRDPPRGGARGRECGCARRGRARLRGGRASRYFRCCGRR